MSSSLVSLWIAGTVLALLQFVAALPWLWAIDPIGFRAQARRPAALAYALGGVLAAGFGVGFYLSSTGDTATLETYGRYYGSLLHLQLVVDVLILVPRLLVFFWPKGGAVALAAYREGMRQPMFWLIAALAFTLIVFSMVIPYFTFGDDYKMMKQLGFDTIMLSAVLFGTLAASISINEEIEGRTAITLMSKPVNRRQFLIGKYLGIMMACGAMMLILGWCLTWALHIKASGLFDRLDEVNDTMPAEVQAWLIPKFESALPTPEGDAVARGSAMWFGEAGAHHLALVLCFGQVMVLVAIATALATRMSFVVNLAICLVIFFLGNLAPVLVQVTQKLASQEGSSPLLLVSFLAQVFNVLLPSLQTFNLGPAIIRDSPLAVNDFAVFVGSAFAYALLYTVIALLAGLILFEDRDLA